MATISNTPRPGYVWDATDNVWYPIGVGGHGHPDYITQATAVNPTIIDAKGDIITATAADTPARLAVGNNGETLVADSAASTGLRYQSAYNGNSVINGAFDIAQRGTSIAVGAAYPYTLDRWQAVRGGVVAGMTVSRQTSALTGTQYCARIQRDSGNTSTASMGLYNAFESSNTYPLAGQAVTFSFYARAGANYSGGTLSGILTTGTGTDQNPITAVYTGATSPISVGATLTTSWQRFQGTATLSSSATEMYVYFQWIPTGTAGANDYVEVSGVQVELGSIATTFKRAGGATIQGELAACQRYFQIFGGNDVFEYYGIGANLNTVNANCVVQWYVPMRTAPTATFTTASNYRVTQGTSANTCTGAVGDVDFDLDHWICGTYTATLHTADHAQPRWIGSACGICGCGRVH
jgi:hypothetical protein